jgi:hypothetical protein
MHEYPHYMLAGKKVPVQHMAFGCLLSVFLLVKLATSGSKKVEAAKAVEFPAPKRNWEAEKEEFIANYLAEDAKKQHH